MTQKEDAKSMRENSKSRRGPNLKTAAQVTTQMGKIYRKALRGELELEEYRILNDGLSKMRDGMLAIELERRLESLENSKSARFPDRPLMLKAVK